MKILVVKRIRFAVWLSMALSTVGFCVVNLINFPGMSSVIVLVCGVGMACVLLWVGLRGAVVVTKDGCRAASWGSTSPYVEWKNVREFRSRTGEIVVVVRNGFEFAIARYPLDIWMSEESHARICRAFCDRLEERRRKAVHHPSASRFDAS